MRRHSSTIFKANIDTSYTRQASYNNVRTLQFFSISKMEVHL